MVLLPKVLYILWHSPVYLVLKHFKILETLIKPFVWGNNRHKLPWHKLKHPTDLAGMALPDFNTYYVAAQLSQIFHIDKVDRDRFLHSLCPKWTRQTLDSLVAITGEGRDKGQKKDRKSLLYQYRRVWEMASDRMNVMSPHSCTHLWHNTSLPEFNLLHDNRV